MRRGSSVITEYGSLDPTGYADPDHLLSMYHGLRPIQRIPAFATAAAIALELAQNPQNPQALRSNFMAAVLSSYGWINAKKRFRLPGDSADMTRAHLPYLEYGDQVAARKMVADNTLQLMQGWNQEYSRLLARSKIASSKHGSACELGAAMLAHSIGAGLIAHPALPRQDVNHVRVDGRRYRWDVTIESDGSILERGVYRTQVKSAAYMSWEDDYHPEITVLPLGCILGERADVFAIERLVSVPDEAAASRLACVQDQLLERLDETGPATDELVYLA